MRKHTCNYRGMVCCAMYQRHKLPKRLTLLFLFFSASLWTARLVQLHWQRCTDYVIKTNVASIIGHTVITSEPTKGVELEPSVRNITNWFERRLRVIGQNTVQSTCNRSFLESVPHDYHILQSLQRSATGNSNNFATLTAIGELHLRLDTGSGLERNAAKLLSGISSYIEDSDEVITSLADGVSEREDTSILSSLRSMGVSLVSLASEPISQLAAKTDRIRQTTRTLEAAQLKWFGLNAKKHHIVTVNGQRIGCLAFCAVHGMCTDSSQLPFGPVKYSPKAASTIVKELKSHGVSLIIVLVYWGLRTSLFPDEMALPIARHLTGLGVDVIIGYHPSGIQGHAYMGRTLILFSLGQILSSDHAVSYCWNKVSNRWRYSVAKECQAVQPAARKGLFQRETHTRIYKIHISKSEVATADYVTLSLRYGEDRTRKPLETGSRQNWTRVCGERDIHCLSCDQF